MDAADAKEKFDLGATARAAPLVVRDGATDAALLIRVRCECRRRSDRALTDSCIVTEH